jgi:transcriptional regulator with GAF, ATPase, and Fis domain
MTGAADEAAEEATAFAGIIGQSAPMRGLFRMLERLRTTDATVLVTGENGTGKELVARAVHTQSRRAARRFVATNCGALADTLRESELFGHRRGAFTGAVNDKPGLFEVADGGTFFLDEVGDMSPALQVKLLRVLQEGVFFPVGAVEPRRVDVRVVAATHRELSSLVTRGTFREDLFYRLNVVTLRVPPLRERADDVPLLVRHFLTRLAARDGRTKTPSPALLAALSAHRWPGNVRELENELERVWVLTGPDTMLTDAHLSKTIARRAVVRSAARAIDDDASMRELDPTLAGLTLPAAVERLERRMITDALTRTGGNKSHAALLLGVSRRNLIRKVRALGLGAQEASDDVRAEGDDAAHDDAADDESTR